MNLNFLNTHSIKLKFECKEEGTPIYRLPCELLELLTNGGFVATLFSCALETFVCMSSESF